MFKKHLKCPFMSNYFFPAEAERGGGGVGSKPLSHAVHTFRGKDPAWLGQMVGHAR